MCVVERGRGGPIYFNMGLIHYRLESVVMEPGVPVTMLYLGTGALKIAGRLTARHWDE